MSSTHWARQVYLCCLPAYPIGYLVVHGFRGDQFWTRFYVNRYPLEAPDHLKELIEKELDKLDDIRHAKMRLALTDRLEPRVYGGFFLTSGVELQFPLRFAFTDVEHARRQGAHVETDLGLAKHRRKLEVNSEVCDELFARLMLSEPAKQFAVQRQLQIARSGSLFCAPMIAWGGIWTACYMIIPLIAPAVGTVAATLAAGTVSTIGFLQIRRQLEKYAITRADELVIERDPSLIAGARDYLQSTMKLNRLLRRIFGEEGEQCIQKSGESKLDPISSTVRLHQLENFVKKLKSATKE